jgi:xanthine dehydrogenase large subunit
MSGKRHGFHAQWRVGFDGEGRLQALEATLTSDGGWSLDLSEPVLARALCHVDNNYWIPDIRVTGRVARTHKTSQTAFRGFGGPQGMLVIEDILGRCAPLLGIEAHELRRRNFYEDGQTTPYGQVITQADRVQRAWEQVAVEGDLDRRRAEIAAFNATHDHVKRAVAVTPVKFGISFNLTAFNQAGALVHVYKDGSVLVNHGGTEMGQGLHTKMLQVAATTLGVPLDLVRLAPTRTDKVPNTSATAASSGADLNGGAVKDACEQIRDRLAQVAASRLGVPAPDVRFADGVVSGLGSDQVLPWADLVHSAYFARTQLFAAGYYRTEGLHWNSTVMRGSPFKYFAHGVAATEVEVDGFTGACRTRRVDIVHDVGDSLSPLVDIGQIEGAYVQGAGWLTLEDLRWDEGDGAQRGRLATASASTYKLPSFSEMPEVFHVSLLGRAHEEGAVYGSKAVGEPPLMLAFAVREALRQACAAFGPEGTSVDLASPATPEAVFWALQEARAGHDPEVEAGAGPTPPEADPAAPTRHPESESVLQHLSEA